MCTSMRWDITVKKNQAITQFFNVMLICLENIKSLFSVFEWKQYEFIERDNNCEAIACNVATLVQLFLSCMKTELSCRIK